MEKITKKEMFAAIATAVETGEWGYSAEDVKAFCENEIALLEKKAEKAKARAAEKRAEGDALTDAVAAQLTGEFEPIADIAARVAETVGEDATVAKVTYRLNQLVKMERAEKQEISIAGTAGNKTRKIQGYRAVAVDTADAE